MKTKNTLILIMVIIILSLIVLIWLAERNTFPPKICEKEGMEHLEGLYCISEFGKVYRIDWVEKKEYILWESKSVN